MDYSIYKRTRREWVYLYLTWAGISVLFGLLFYRHILAIFLLFPFVYFYEKYDRGVKIKKRKEKLSDEFLEAMHIMSASMQAGNSLEHSISRCRTEIRTLLPEDALMVRELDAMKHGLACNVNVEELFLDLGRRSGVPEINEFAEVCDVSKRAGGNIVRVMAHTVKVIDSRKSMEREIRVITSAKRLEGHIMDILLPGLLLYLDVSMPDMMASMYTGLIGRGLMTLILALYCVSFFWMEKITDVKV